MSQGEWNPKTIGIALAAYRPDCRDFAEQLRTIAEQTYPHWICVITLDSPLKDLETEELLAPYFRDSRFRWFQNPARLGHKKNFERAITLVVQERVDAVACCDQDDLWYPDKLEVTLGTLKNAGPLSLVHTDMHGFDQSGVGPETIWQLEKRGIAHSSTQHLLVRNIVAGCSMLLDVELARKYPRIPDGAEYHDHWYALVASVFGGVHAINRPLFAYRQHPENVVGASPFQGVFHFPRGSTLRSLAEKCRNCWRKSHRLARAAVEEGLPLSPEVRRVFLDRGDLGFRFFFRGLAYLFNDRPLGRACLARAVGKFLDYNGLKKP